MPLERYKQNSDAAGLIEGLAGNQRKLASELESNCDFIGCGSGPPESVVARRWQKNPR